jgi:Lar family restriction alleviation protein
MAAVTLLPCPFCGGEAYHPKISGSILGQVWCKGCEVEMHFGEDAIPTADEQWNTRASTPSASAGELVERARVAALVALAEHGQTTDIQEFLVRGVPGVCKPGALDAMVAAVLALTEARAGEKG